MRAAGVILTKDLRLRVRDRSVFLFAFVVPLGLAFVFSLVFPDTDEFQMSAAVVDLDGGPVAAGFVDGVVPQLVAAGVVEIEDVQDEDAARDAVERGTVDAAWIVPAGFSEAATAGRGGSLRALVNPERALAAEVARGVAEGYGTRIDRAALAAATAATALDVGGDAPEVERAVTEAVTRPPPVTLDELVAEDRRLDPVSRLAAGMAVFFLFFTVQFGVAGLLEERDLGTLPRLLAAPIGASAVHVGKALGAFVLGVVSMTVLVIVSSLLLDAHWGHPVGVAILIVAGVLCAVGIMALVASFARTAEQAGNLQSIVALILGLLGGVFFPVGGGLLDRVSLVSPHRWFLRGLGDVVGTGEWSAALPAAAALVCVGAVAAIPGMWRLRRATA